MVPPIRLFDRPLYPYTIAAIVGAVVTLLFAYRTAKRQALNERTMLFALLFAAAGAFLGGHLLYALTNAGALCGAIRRAGAFDGFGSFLKLIYPYFSGAVFYGGLICGVAFAWLYLRRTKKPLGGYTDVGAVCIPLFHAFGRIGCFLSGCCYGVESELGFVLRYSTAPGGNGVRRFPVQLCEAAFNFALALVLYSLLKKQKLRGRLLHVYFFAYPVFRFLIEFLRGDESRGFWLGLSTSQWISLLLLLCNTAHLLLAGRRAGKKNA